MLSRTDMDMPIMVIVICHCKLHMLLERFIKDLADYYS